MISTSRLGWMFEMSNIHQDETGLPMIIWASPKGKSKHGPRIKVSTSHSHKITTKNLVSVTIGENPKIIGQTKLNLKDFKLVKRFIILNRKLLLDFWNSQTMSSKKFLDSIIPYSEQTWNAFLKDNPQYEEKK